MKPPKVYDDTNKVLNEPFGEGKGNIMECIETFFESLLTRDHLYIFTCFLGFIFICKEKTDAKVMYIKQLKQYSKIPENKLISINTESECVSLTNTMNYLHNDSII